MRHKEDNLQIQCVGWFAWEYSELTSILHHSPNGGRRSLTEAARFKAMGTRAGVSDLIILTPRHGYGCLCIEMKTEVKSSRQSESQKEWQKAVELAGNKYVICRSLDEFMKEINDYLS